MEILGDVLAAILILAALLLLRLAMSQGKKRRGLLRILGERPSGQRMLSLFRKQAP
jgi:hypothetical protein